LNHINEPHRIDRGQSNGVLSFERGFGSADQSVIESMGIIENIIKRLNGVDANDGCLVIETLVSICVEDDGLAIEANDQAVFFALVDQTHGDRDFFPAAIIEKDILELQILGWTPIAV
jgi:hypothetical protein